MGARLPDDHGHHRRPERTTAAEEGVEEVTQPAHASLAERITEVDAVLGTELVVVRPARRVRQALVGLGQLLELGFGLGVVRVLGQGGIRAPCDGRPS